MTTVYVKTTNHILNHKYLRIVSEIPRLAFPLHLSRPSKVSS